MVLVATLLCTLGTFSAPAMAEDKKEYHAKVGPPDPIPKEFEANSGGDSIGIDKQGHYCYEGVIRDQEICRTAKPGEIPGRIDICEGADGTAARNCDEEGQKEYELKRLKQWQEATKDKRNLENWPKLNQALTKCVNEGGIFKDCLIKWEGEYPLTPGVGEWVAGKISKFASDALQEAARYIGEGVVWLLEEFANLFNKSSSINLAQTGIGKPLGITMAISAMLAAFLMLIQFGKTAMSQRGELAGTAVGGLLKWAVVSSVYLIFTEQALVVADELSEWMIEFSFGKEGGAGDAMKEQLGKLFGALAPGGGAAAVGGTMLVTGEALAPAAVGVVIVIGVITIVAIGALWVEMLMRQAGIMILVVAMPIVLTGEITDSTKNWWPSARNAMISLILMKPVIVLLFTIGFFAMGESSGVQNVIVGLVIFLGACFCWPVLAKFMTFTTNGEGSSMMSGLMSSIGSSASSQQSGGAGSVGGGSGYTKALEREAAPMDAGSGGGGGAALGGAAKGGFAGAMSAATVGLQLAAVGKDALESGMSNTAANAGLGHGAPGGRHAVIAQRRASEVRAAEVPEVPEAPPEASFVEVPPPPPRQGVRVSPAEPTQMYDGTEPMAPPSPGKED
ncbi:hypothetical protein [Streptomyces sp. NBC_00091]|uniref:hypothetical protein n=1 Tax=Streptomyces sp. NBC_00091 TaxID=2975648 RepID=UPI00225295E3|nr:hypothetical protein [Streptomyces sp. NBC_00091]MCX5374962.1 hypothetical protein [Streptomyces sp. NBC_00091]